MANFPFKPSDYFDATDDKSASQRLDPEALDEIFNVIADIINNKLARGEGWSRYEESFNFSGASFPVTIEHNLGQKHVSTVQFFDSNDDPFEVSWTAVDEDNIEVETTYDGTGTLVIKV